MAAVQQKPLTLDHTFNDLLQHLGDAYGDEARFKQAIEKAREALRNAEIFQQLIENVHEVLRITDWKQRKELYVSKSYETLWGRSCESLYANARSWLDNVHPEDRERVRQAFEHGAERGEYCEEYRIIHPDGAIRWVYDRSIPIRDDSGCVYRMAGISEDLTERKLAEDQLRKAHDQLERRVEHRTAALTALNLPLASQETALRLVVEGTSSKLGQAFFDSVARHLAGAVGARFGFISEVVDGGHRLARLLSLWNHDHEAALFSYDTAGTPCGHVLENQMYFCAQRVQDFYPKDRWLKDHNIESYLAVPLCDSAGQVIGHMGVAHTAAMEDSEIAQSIIMIFATRVVAEMERRRAEQDRERLRERLYQAQKMKAIGELASGVGHDFNNLLLVMFAGLDQLRDQITDPAAREAFETLERATHEAHDVTQALLSASRAAPTGNRRVAMTTVLETLPDVLRLMLPATVELSIDNDLPDPCMICGSPLQLRRVIINLVANARDALLDGGRVCVSLAQATLQDCQQCDVNPERPWVAIRVSDSGHGMSAATLSRASEPFFTTKTRTKGTGLGLPIAQRITRDHGGHLDLTSKVGGGTRVVILLPQVDVE